jgi:hypothetical protein
MTRRPPKSPPLWLAVAEVPLGALRRRLGTLMDSNGQSATDTVQCKNGGKIVISTQFPPSGSVCTSGGGPGLQNQRHLRPKPRPGRLLRHPWSSCLSPACPRPAAGRRAEARVFVGHCRAPAGVVLAARDGLRPRPRCPGCPTGIRSSRQNGGDPPEAGAPLPVRQARLGNAGQFPRQLGVTVNSEGSNLNTTRSRSSQAGRLLGLVLGKRSDRCHGANYLALPVVCAILSDLEFSASPLIR